MKDKIKASFSKSAATYDEHAAMHEEIIGQLVSSLTGNYQNILDIGCGTGTLALKLSQKYPQAKIIGLDLAPAMIACAKAKINNPRIEFLVGDGEALGFKAGSFDLVVSTSSLHWMEHAKVFKEVWRVLKKGGEFCFTSFGTVTLAEVRGAGLSVNDFPEAKLLEKELNNYFSNVKIKSEIIKQCFPGPLELFHYLKNIGGQCVLRPKAKGLLTPRKLKSLPRPCQTDFEIYYGLANC